MFYQFSGLPNNKKSKKKNIHKYQALSHLSVPTMRIDGNLNPPKRMANNNID
jgi:hypothetical protein